MVFARNLHADISSNMVVPNGNDAPNHPPDIPVWIYHHVHTGMSREHAINVLWNSLFGRGCSEGFSGPAGEAGVAQEESGRAKVGEGVVEATMEEY